MKNLHRARRFLRRGSRLHCVRRFTRRNLRLKPRLSLCIIALSLPFIVWGTAGILPTFDDYTTLQSPQFSPFLSDGLLPGDGFWRPWDYLFGCLLGRFTWLFPALNHVMIILGHTLSTLLVYKLCRQLAFNSLATNTATLFFFFSPATLGATLAVDGLNQTYAQFWGLLALTIYLNKPPKFLDAPSGKDERGGRRSEQAFKPTLGGWGLFFIVMAALSKENGLAWAVVPPVFVCAFGLLSLRRAFRHILVGLGVALLYAVVRVLLNTSQTVGEDYVATTFVDHLKDLAQLLAYTWVPLDYASIFYLPARNWPLAALTLMLSAPFLLLIFVHGLRLLRSRKLLLLIVCFLILASPHLLTLTSIMHNYAALSMAAIIMAVIIQSIPQKSLYTPPKFLDKPSGKAERGGWGAEQASFNLQPSARPAGPPCPSVSPTGSQPQTPTFARARTSQFLNFSISQFLNFSIIAFLLAALITDLHHFLAAYQSGLLSREMAMETIRKTGEKADRVFCISIASSDDIPGYSSFYVRPVDAFAWGLSVRRYTNYQWPETITDTVIGDESQVSHITDSVFQTNTQYVWIVDNKKSNVTVVKNKNL